MTPRFIYFDLDDTLLDHKGAEAAALGDVHSQFSLFKDIDLEELVQTYHHINRAQWEQYAKGQLTRQQLQRNRFEITLRKLKLDPAYYKEVGTFYVRCYRDYWRWITGAKEVFIDLSRKLEIGILTNGFSETQKLKFERFRLHEYARHLVISEDVGTLKPHPRVFQHATDLTGYSASEILYIGDSFVSDVIGGSEFGWMTAWYTANAANESKEKLNKADFVFDSFKDLYQWLDVSA